MIFLVVFIFELFILFLLSRELTNTLSRLFFRIFKNKHAAMYLLSILFLPGTLIHELAHYFMAAILLVKVGEITLLPKIEKDEVQLGAVAIGKTDPFRRFFIGVSPVLCGIVLLLTTLFYFQTATFLDVTVKTILLGYIVFEIANTMFSSRRDMEGALELFLAISVVYVALYFLGLRISIGWSQVAFLNSSESVLKTITLYLSFPIFIDAVIILFIRLGSFLIKK